MSAAPLRQAARANGLFFLAFSLCFLTGCGGSDSPWAVSGATMGTSYNVKVVPPPGVERLAEQDLPGVIQARLDDINDKMSAYSEDSELSRFNQFEDTAPFPVSKETAAVFAIAQQVSEASGGAFDVTVGPLVNAWGFGPVKRSEPPTDEQVAALKERLGYRNVTVDVEACTLRKARPDVYCDLAAVAKGYAVDEVARALEEHGYTDYMVEVGGEVRVRGAKPGGVPWRIGIEKPDAPPHTVQQAIALSDQAMATSGDYRNYYERDGVRLSHTIDPRTGRPITHKLASVSVLHEECAWADAYATAMMVLGPEEGWELAEKQDLAAYFIVRDDTGGFVTRATPAFQRLLDHEPQGAPAGKGRA